MNLNISFKIFVLCIIYYIYEYWGDKINLLITSLLAYIIFIETN